MRLETNIDVEVINSLDFDMDDSCEHSDHEEGSRVHSGKGEWWRISAVCPDCGRTPAVILVCDRWRLCIDANKLNVRCSAAEGCGSRNPSKDWGMVFVRKDSV